MNPTIYIDPDGSVTVADMPREVMVAIGLALTGKEELTQEDKLKMGIAGGEWCG